VPIVDNVPSRRTVTDDEGDVLHGCGTVDMKSGDAVFLHSPPRWTSPRMI
jgi:succinyl-diaminopimelate desuccinylase